MKVAVTGATGFVGSRLVERLQADGHSIVVFTRDPDRGRQVFPAEAFPQVEIVAYTPAEAGPWQEQISGCDGVVNLAGEPIAERWTESRKQEILESRKQVTRRIVEAIAAAKPRPKVLISTSAIGYYGTSETETFDETSRSGNDFLAKVCQTWELEAEKVTKSRTRLVILRVGIVLGMGGAIAKMLLPFKLYAGGPIGSGNQWFSWIHREDLVSLIIKALTNNKYKGVYNATAPNPVRMTELCSALGDAMNRPSWLPVPGFALEALLGDGAQVVLEGQEVLPKRTLKSGFKYDYPDVEVALEDIVQEA